MHAIKHSLLTCILRVISLVAYQKLFMSLKHGRFSKRPSIKDHSPSMTLDVASVKSDLRTLGQLLKFLAKFPL